MRPVLARQATGGRRARRLADALPQRRFQSRRMALAGQTSSQHLNDAGRRCAGLRQPVQTPLNRRHQQGMWRTATTARCLRQCRQFFRGMYSLAQSHQPALFGQLIKQPRGRAAVLCHFAGSLPLEGSYCRAASSGVQPARRQENSHSHRDEGRRPTCQCPRRGG